MTATKTIIDKLNLHKFPTKAVLYKPEDIREFDEMEFDEALLQEKYDVIFMFIFSLEEFVKGLKQVVDEKLLHDKGYLFFAYPKKNNPQYAQYIDRDSFLSAVPVDENGYYEASPLKFARMVSFNEVFTVVGLKCDPPKQRKSANPPKSQCVDDYIVHIDDIKRHLERHEELLEMYNQLTPGYQKDWARYVYSAKHVETQEKRLLEMESILAAGYKSIALYRRDKK